MAAALRFLPITIFASPQTEIRPDGLKSIIAAQGAPRNTDLPAG
jgi:hypothetical protein